MTITRSRRMRRLLACTAAAVLSLALGLSGTVSAAAGHFDGTPGSEV